MIIKLILTVLIGIVIFTATMVIRTSDLKRVKSKQPQIRLSDKFQRYLKRANITVERFIAINGLLIIAILIVLIKALVVDKHVDIKTFIVIYLGVVPLYFIIINRNERYKVAVKADLEKIIRISYFLERSGTEEREIYRHLSTLIEGPMKSYMIDIASSYKLRKDQKELFEAMKYDFDDLHEVVAYINICLQKLDTGSSERIMKNQMREIKKLKQEKYRLNRYKNRRNIVLISVFLGLSFLSVVVYPLLTDTLNNMSNVLY